MKLKQIEELSKFVHATKEQVEQKKNILAKLTRIHDAIDILKSVGEGLSGVSAAMTRGSIQTEFGLLQILPAIGAATSAVKYLIKVCVLFIWDAVSCLTRG